MRGSPSQIRHDWTSHLFQAKLILIMTAKIYHRVNFERDMARVVWPVGNGIGPSQMSFSGKEKNVIDIWCQAKSPRFMGYCLATFSPGIPALRS